MRKILLATAATMGALLATAGGAKAQPLPTKVPAAGTIIVHLNGYLQFEIGDFGSTFNTVTTTAASATNTVAGTYKLNPVTTDGDFRIYPGFDAQTVSGIEYGVQGEIRADYSDGGVGENGKISPSVTTTSTIAGTKITSTTFISNAENDGFYVKRAYGYVGTPAFGFVRLGQTDSAFTLDQVGVIEAFGDGGQWTLEGGVDTLLPSNAAPTSTIIYADQSAVYSTDKIVYISPAYIDPLLGGGLSATVGFEPNSNGLKEGYDNYSGANSLSADLSASPVPSDIGKKRKNTVDAAIEYVLKANGFASKFSVAILHGAPIAYDGAAVPFSAAKPSALTYGYDELNVFQAGAQTTYAGVTLGANIKEGAVEDGYTFKPKGARNALTYIIGGDYVLGPYVIGASYFNAQSAGSYIPGAAEAKTLSEYGAVVGGNYVIGKDLSLFAQYMYGHRHQHGNSALSASGNGQAQVIAAGATFKW